MQGLGRLLSWIDNDRKGLSVDVGQDAVDWRRVWPFVGIHLACLATLWVGWSPVAVWVAVGAYLVRMFAITAFYHRYFAHKSFRTSRPVQFVFAVLGASATQRGPLWWSAHHRHHHRTSDTEADPHSPRHGFWRSHAGWFLGGKYFKAPLNLVKDFSQYPELRWLDRFDMCVPLAFGFGMWCLGEGLAYMAPQLQTNGWQMLVWGYFISTVVLIHATLAINSLAHRWGTQRYETGDDSRNNFILALLTLGEGWHNNHHHYSGSARQGFFWWELDLSYYLLRLMAAAGLIWDLRDVPEHKKWAHKPEISGLTLNGGRR